MNAVVKAEFDRVWLELAELRQSLNARPIAPTPDYRSDLPADDQCGCEESERLKAELGEAQVRLQSAENEMRRLGYGVEDIVCFSRSSGRPICMSNVGDLSWDTVENKRATVKWINEREQVEKDLLAQIDQLKSRVSIEVRTCADWVLAKEAADKRLAAANALLTEATPWIHNSAFPARLAVRIENHLSSHPAAPKRNDSEQRLLDAMSDVGYTDLELLRDRPGESDGLKRAAAAELARRGHG